jgi:hypothetical protein
MDLTASSVALTAEYFFLHMFSRSGIGQRLHSKAVGNEWLFLCQQMGTPVERQWAFSRNFPYAQLPKSWLPVASKLCQ